MAPQGPAGDGTFVASAKQKVDRVLASERATGVAFTDPFSNVGFSLQMAIFPASAAGHRGSGGTRKRKGRRDLTAGAAGGKEAGLDHGRAAAEKPPPTPTPPLSRLVLVSVDGAAVAFATTGSESALAPGVSVSWAHGRYQRRPGSGAVAPRESHGS